MLWRHMITLKNHIDFDLSLIYLLLRTKYTSRMKLKLKLYDAGTKVKLYEEN